jgi:hypothetical protein
VTGKVRSTRGKGSGAASGFFFFVRPMLRGQTKIVTSPANAYLHVLGNSNLEISHSVFQLRLSSVQFLKSLDKPINAGMVLHLAPNVARCGYEDIIPPILTKVLHFTVVPGKRGNRTSGY